MLFLGGQNLFSIGFLPAFNNRYKIGFVLGSCGWAPGRRSRRTIKLAFSEIYNLSLSFGRLVGAFYFVAVLEIAPNDHT